MDDGAFDLASIGTLVYLEVFVTQATMISWVDLGPQKSWRTLKIHWLYSSHMSHFDSAESRDYHFHCNLRIWPRDLSI